MWRTSQGDRVLAGAEAAAFRAGLGDLVEDLAEWGDEQSTGVAAFDALSLGQKVALLADLTDAILSPSIPTPFHTAANEAAVYAVYRHLFTLIEVELDGDGICTDARRLVRAGCFERGLEALAEHDDDLDAWRESVESLSDQVLWDRDFDDGDMFLDAPPEGAKPDEAGMDGEYFAAVPRDLTDTEISKTMSRLRQLAG